MPKIGPETTGGSLVAYDPVTQKERWHAEGGGGIGGGTVTTAGNLVIQVLNTGKLRAYTADKGEKLLDIDTPARNGMGPPITFMLDGKQYIALNGGTGQFPGAARGGPAGPPPDPNAPPPPPPAKPQLMVFMVDGKATK
jgi:glucose dehydrogenase